MVDQTQGMLGQAGMVFRAGAAAVIAGLWRNRSLAEVHDWLGTLPKRQNAMVVGGVFATLFLLSLLAAQFGWIGMALYFLAVIVIVN